MHLHNTSIFLELLSCVCNERRITDNQFGNLQVEYVLFMAVGTGGAGGGAIAPPPPPIFCQPKKFKSLKITTYKSVYSNKDKIGF